MELMEIRRQIDSIDSEIINLLAKRALLVSAAGKLKKDEQGVRDPKRVEQVIEKARSKAASAGLSPEIAEKVYRTIVECFINKELLDFSRHDRN
jgi:isochorismate pyruvate lyase